MARAQGGSVKPAALSRDEREEGGRGSGRLPAVIGGCLRPDFRRFGIAGPPALSLNSSVDPTRQPGPDAKPPRAGWRKREQHSWAGEAEMPFRRIFRKIHRQRLIWQLHAVVRAVVGDRLTYSPENLLRSDISAYGGDGSLNVCSAFGCQAAIREAKVCSAVRSCAQRVTTEKRPASAGVGPGWRDRTTGAGFQRRDARGFPRT